MAEQGTSGNTAVFSNARLAQENLARIGDKLPQHVVASILTLCSDLADPDAALNLLERLVARQPSAIQALTHSPRALHYALALFSHSQWLGETVILNADLLPALARPGALDRTPSAEDLEESLARFRARSFDSDISLVLSRFKRREFVRVALRDVLGIATLAEVTAEISAVADVLISAALTECDRALRNRYGAPLAVDDTGRVLEPGFAVLSLGKLGGVELNYSSDIDLLYLFDDEKEAPGVGISNREYFVRLAQELTAVLSRPTPEGAPFRIDLRLRPQGNEGQLAVGVRAAADYYANRAGDWERQALVKARLSAGDVTLARSFLRGVQPFVYASGTNLAAIETALLSREMIRAHRSRTASLGGDAIDVKVDRGGIRDIEFLVQCLQRVYGGDEPWLRSGGTLFSLQKLHDKRHITGSDFDELTAGYEFLRAVEHRLQVRLGQQTHKIPRSDLALRSLARSLTPRFLASGEPEELFALLRSRMEAVAAIYDRVIHQQHVAPEPAVTPSGGREETHRQLLTRLAIEAPAWHAAFERPDLTPHTKRNLLRFLSSASTSPDRYETIVAAQHLVDSTLRILSVSELLADILMRHPEEIRSIESPSGDVRNSAVAHTGDALTGVRRVYRSRIFASGVRDVLNRRSVYESLALTTDAAEEAIRSAIAAQRSSSGLAVMAFGRLGTHEHDALSDADLLFVHHPEADQRSAATDAVRLIEALSAYTRDGSVFPVDARLRPRGTQGELTVSPEHLSCYLLSEAQPWEAIAYTKLRHIAGNHEAATIAMEAIVSSRASFSIRDDFIPQLRATRARLEANSRQPLKSAPGGLYDIDYICGALAVRADIAANGNLRERLGTLRDAGLLDATEHAALDRAAELYRATDHAVRLVTGAPRKALPVSGVARQNVETLVAAMLGRPLVQGLEFELAAARGSVRALFNTVFTRLR